MIEDLSQTGEFRLEGFSRAGWGEAVWVAEGGVGKEGEKRERGAGRGERWKEREKGGGRREGKKRGRRIPGGGPQESREWGGLSRLLVGAVLRGVRATRWGLSPSCSLK